MISSEDWAESEAVKLGIQNRFDRILDVLVEFCKAVTCTFIKEINVKCLKCDIQNK